jgi:hypothetical protein
MWIMDNNVILTKDNMIKYFCNQPESITHLFYSCCVPKVVWAIVAIAIGATDIPRSPQHCWNWCKKWLPNRKKYYVFGIVVFCWAIWKARNKACFDGKLLNNPTEIVCHASALMRFWAGLYADGDQEMLIDGVNAMLKIVVKLLTKLGKKKRNIQMIQDANGEGDDEEKLV